VICGRYNVSPSKVYVVRAGVDLNKFKVYAKANRKVFKVLYSGAFSVAYDFDQVLLAAKLLENVKDVEFILQGEGELARYLKARVRGLKLENVKIVDRILSRDEVAKLLSKADALILPLRHPLVFYGIPGVICLLIALVSGLMLIHSFNLTRYFSLPLAESRSDSDCWEQYYARRR
jgi:glycosyltransferase involved in cell wall biosynthesis